MCLRGWALAQEGAAEAGIELMCRNAADRAALGVSWFQARYLCMLAAVYAQTGQAEAGLRVIAEARNLVARNDEHMWESELDRIEGELRRMQGASASDVEACFARAVARSHEQCATSLELRAGASRAQLWRDHGKRSEARDLLAPVYGQFTEGFDTRDLKEAKALLEALGRVNTSDDHGGTIITYPTPTASQQGPIWPLAPERQKRQRPWRRGGQEF
jgi:predicted ATPase